MPDRRLQKYRDAYVLRCGHQSIIASRVRNVTLPNGFTIQEREPQRFRVRGPDARFCLGCGQIVDATDDAEAR